LPQQSAKLKIGQNKQTRKIKAVSKMKKGMEKEKVTAPLSVPLFRMNEILI